MLVLYFVINIERFIFGGKCFFLNFFFWFMFFFVKYRVEIMCFFEVNYIVYVCV